MPNLSSPWQVLRLAVWLSLTLSCTEPAPPAAKADAAASQDGGQRPLTSDAGTDATTGVSSSARAPDATAAPTAKVRPAVPPVGKLVKPACDGAAEGDVSMLHHVQAGTTERVHDILARYQCRHAGRAILVELGRSHLDMPVLALFIGNDVRRDHDKPTLLLNGGHHGAELMSTLFVLDAIGTLLEDASDDTRRILDELVIVAVPLVNPDGNHLTTTQRIVGRKNGRDLDGDGRRTGGEGVDLNRNYPFRWGALGEKGSSSNGVSQYYRGPSAASEPETQAMMRLADSERFAASLSYHTGTIAILAPYTIPGVKSPKPNVNKIVAHEIAAGVVGHPEGAFPVRKNLYPVDGTDQDWLFATFGTLALLIEGADYTGRPQAVRRLMVKTVRKTWQLLAKRFLNGPMLSGRVRGAIDPVVSIDELATFEGERWTTRPRDGRFDRFVPKNGSYTVRIQRRDQPDVVRQLTVDGNTFVDIAVD